jgi:aerobic C4-dicarboxylate transport protein
MKYIKKSLTFWVLTALVLGILVGTLSPKTGVAMQPLGKYFIELVKLFINPIIVVTVLTGICGMESLKKVGRVGAKTFIYFEIVTSIALVIGLIVAYVINPGAGIDQNLRFRILENIREIAVQSTGSIFYKVILQFNFYLYQ